MDESSSVDMHIGRTVHGCLWERRITQRRLATHLGIDETVVSKMLRGNRSWTITDLYATAGLLGIDPDELLPREVSAMASASVSARSEARNTGGPTRRSTGWYSPHRAIQRPRDRLTGNPRSHGATTTAATVLPFPRAS